MTLITVMAEEGPITISFDDLVRYHGHAALAMLAIAFRAQQAVFAQLCPAAPPLRDAISVVSGHPGPGVRDAFEMVTRCVTRGAYRIDPAISGPRLNPNGVAVYAFEIAISGCGNQTIALRPDVLPAEFFKLLGARAKSDIARGFALRRHIAGDVMTRSLDELFTVARDDAYSQPSPRGNASAS